MQKSEEPERWSRNQQKVKDPWPVATQPVGCSRLYRREEQRGENNSAGADNLQMATSAVQCARSKSASWCVVGCGIGYEATCEADEGRHGGSRVTKARSHWVFQRWRTNIFPIAKNGQAYSSKAVREHWQDKFGKDSKRAACILVSIY